MTVNRKIHAPLLVLTAALAACGGGGAGASGASVAIGAMVAPANFNFATMNATVLTAAAVLPAVGGFPVVAATSTYVKVWYVDASSQRQQLVFMSLAALQATGATGVSVQVPGDIHTLAVEVYDANTSKTGTITA